MPTPSLPSFSPEPQPGVQPSTFPDPTLVVAVACAALCAGAPAWAQTQDLGAVVVTATRTAQPAFDIPASIDALDADALSASQLQVNLSESLARVPGIVAQNRQNYAQDLQISSRGFGARSTFGVRGLRLFVDGIPATMPDGQGQTSHIDLTSADRIEVLRGPFSTLYGNSSGGVVNIFTQDGGPDTVAELSAAFGSDHAHRVGVQLSGQQGAAQYLISANRFQTDGYREHSAAERSTFNGKFSLATSEDSRWTLVLNSVDMPEAQDPLGLTRTDWQADPRQVASVATLYNTRKSVNQSQAGLILNQRLGRDDRLQWTSYYGERETVQYQAIPPTSQQAASSPGGVIDLSRNYWGQDLRWTHSATLLERPLEFTAGLSDDILNEHRLGFQSFTGPAANPDALGVEGSLRRNELNRVNSFDQYLQASWAFASDWNALLGLRHSKVGFVSSDRYLSNGNDSGSTTYEASTPVAGLLYKLSNDLHLYASFGRGFETPTLNELAYRPGGGGLNFGLAPATSRQWELGTKARWDGWAGPWSANIAYYEARTNHEIAVLTNSGGRSTYQNVGRTLRQGLDASLTGPLGHELWWYAALATLNARYRDSFLTCTAAPCTTPSVDVAAGKRIPGIPDLTFYTELQWRPQASGFETAVEFRQVGKVAVDDRNTDAAPAYGVVNLRVSWTQKTGGWTLREFARLDNVGDRHYAGSVIVNEGNSRFFEPAPGRTWLLGLNAGYTF
ncbi:TonB-dependent receptor [Ideonella sp. B508-1]|uniref:TonB-dependent receptor family protein n=1 Tax=Ideonella sp. B508-1 TaxID=137716 RepID=UPI0003452021|nr:TonB-dependent receptor [Ideonella sp. B508-1]